MNKSVLLISCILLVACTQEQKIEDKSDDPVTSNVVAVDNDEAIVADNAQANSDVNTEKESEFSVKVYEHELGWGYQIFKGNSLVIDQKHIPAIQGIKAFSSMEKAQIAADYVQLQIEKGFFPPTVSPSVLDSLGVLD